MLSLDSILCAKLYVSMDNFSKWLKDELEARSWKQADLVRASGLDSAVVSNIVNGRRKAGETTAKAIAKALNIPAELVFRRASLLPPQPERNEKISEVLYILEQLDEANQSDVADYVRMRLQIQERRGSYDVPKTEN